MSTNTFQPTAKWTPDCNGKQDFDGPLLTISTRYWPAWKSSDNRPSASAAIVVNHGIPHPEEEWADYSTLAEADFAADTETEVKAQVEAWVREACLDVLSRLGVSRLPGDGKKAG
jgi:hypothetical protein